MVDSTFLRKHAVKGRQWDMPFIIHILLHNVYYLKLSQSPGNCGGNKIIFQMFTFNFLILHLFTHRFAALKYCFHRDFNLSVIY